MNGIVVSCDVFIEAFIYSRLLLRVLKGRLPDPMLRKCGELDGTLQ